MATSTPNLNLTKPALNDNADIAVINTNMDLIDAAVAARETLTGAQTKATAAETNAKAYADTKDTAHLADYVRQPGYAVDSGTANHLTVTLNPAPTSYLDGMGVAVKVKVAGSSATDINVNGLGVKAVYDAFGNAVTNFRANTTYSLKYESTSGTFIVQGKGGGGNATATQLLLGAAAATDAGPIVGTMPNRGAVAITPSGSAQGIAAGYHNGSGNVAAVVVPAANVLSGTTIAGTAGTMPNNGAVAMTASNVVQGIAAGYHNGSGTLAAATEVVVPVASVLAGIVIADQTGTMPNRGAVAITPSGSAQGISAGYHNGSGSVAAVTVPSSKVLTGTTIAGTAGTMISRVGSNLVYTPSTADQTIASGFYGGVATDGKVAAVVVPAANVLIGTTIAGTPGTMPNKSAVVLTPSTSNVVIPTGYHSGGGYVVGDADLIASNILAGKTIFNVAGNVQPRKYAAGDKTSNSSKILTVTGLAFTPTLVEWWYFNPTYGHNVCTGFYSAWDGSLNYVTYARLDSDYGSTSSYVTKTGSELYSGGFTVNVWLTNTLISWVALY